MASFLVFLWLNSTQLFAQTYHYEYAFKGSLGVGGAQLEDLADQQQWLPALGLNLLFGKRFQFWEFNLASFITLAKTENQQLAIHGSDIRARGRYRHVTFGPHLRFYHSSPVPWWGKHWHPHISLAPLIGLQSFTFKNGQVQNGHYNLQHKLTYETIGGAIEIGLEQWLNKEQRPMSLNFTYRYMQSLKRTEVGGTKKEVETVHEEKDRASIREHSFMFTWGLLIF